MLFWNIVDGAKPDVFLMPVSTTQYVIASNEASAWRRKYPKREYQIVRTSILEPHKQKEVGK